MSKLYHFILVDDSDLDLFINKKFIQISGLTSSTVTFTSCEQALDYLKKSGQGLPETVVMVDLQMPGIGGFEFVDEFAKLPLEVQRKVKIFMLSSTADPADSQRADINPLISGLIPKPLEIETLKKVLAAS